MFANAKVRTPLPNPEPLQAWAISRVSLIKQVGNYSLEAQNAKLIAMQAQYGFTIPDGMMLDDGGYSGTHFNRPAIRRALSGIAAGQGNAVVFPYLDRFARNVEGGLFTVRKFRELGATVILGDYGPVTDERHCKMQLTLGLMIAEQQRDDIVCKSIEGARQKVANGFAHGGRSPFGWHFVTKLELIQAAFAEGKTLEWIVANIEQAKPANRHRPMPQDIETLRLIADLIMAGASNNAICRELWDRGILSPTGLPRWNSTTLRTIVADRCYSTGVWLYGKREAVAPKKMVIPEEDRRRIKTTWKRRPDSTCAEQKLEGGPVWTPDQQDTLIATLARNGGLSRGRPAEAGGNQALLRGSDERVKFAICGLCGFALTTRHTVRNYYYVCSKRARGATTECLCPGGSRSIRGERLDAAVWEGLCTELDEHIDGLVEEYRGAIIGTVDADELARLKTQAERLAKKVREAQDKELDADDAADKRHYASKVQQYKTELALLQRRLTAFTAEADVVNVDTATIKRAIRACRGITDARKRREIVIGWIQQVAYAEGFAEITLRVPLGDANSKRGQPDVSNLLQTSDSYILLKTKGRVDSGKWERVA